MGASEFTEIVEGTSAGKAFSDAVEQARYMNGHGGYTGTIAEKSDWVEFKLHDAADAEQVADDLMSADFDDEAMMRVRDALGANARRAVDTYNDKWGPAVCLPHTHGRYVFCGLASY